MVVASGLSAPNALLFDQTYPDIVAYTDTNLFAGGGVATLSFDFNVASDNHNMAFGLTLLFPDNTSQPARLKKRAA